MNADLGGVGDFLETALCLLTAAQKAFAEIGITDPSALDMWTALLSGLITQQASNDPGGNRWGRLLDDAVDMFARVYV